MSKLQHFFYYEELHELLKLKEDIDFYLIIFFSFINCLKKPASIEKIPASIEKMPVSIENLPNKILVEEILLKLSLANRLNQQRTCRLWKTLMPLNDKDLKLIPLVEEMLELWHRNDEEKFEEEPKRFL